jgi:predicted DNA-binding transcriptional regulator YafY
MVVDGNSFLRRAQRFFLELRAGRRPNATSLAELCGCSRNTAQRTIYRLRDEYLVPLEYDSSEKGYFLADPTYQLPSLLPAGRDELTALLLARDTLAALDAPDLQRDLDSLWTHLAAGNGAVARDLEPLAAVFSADATVVGAVADAGLLKFVGAAAAGEHVRLTYRSPWRHSENRTYAGRILRVHLSDGSLYLKFHEARGREMILNCAFIKSFTTLDHSLELQPVKDPAFKGAENWLEGFGVWAGSTPIEIRVTIAPPASTYYGAQRWHEDQIDTWQSDTLVRAFPGIVSPELVRRVMSLGRYVRSIDPPELRDAVENEARAMLSAIGDLGVVEK